jgi:FAD/FMN-containing dehydrogenase
VIGPLYDELYALVGRDDVLVDDDLKAGHVTDWTRRWTGQCDAVVRPRDAETVSALLAWCSANRITVVPQGGNTGLVGGSIPPETSTRPVVVLSTRHLTEIGPLDGVSGQITVGAGVTLAHLAAALEGSGWEPGVDLGARESATIGGMAATNAGGTRVVRHGMMRRNVVGVEVVLADGSVVTQLRGLDKDNTGYDIAGLVVGSEGTLGVITRVRLRLVPRRTERLTVLVVCTDWADATDLSASLRRLDGVEALEAVDAVTTGAVRDAGAGEASPGPELSEHEVGLLVEWTGDRDHPADLVELIGVRRHEVALDPRARHRLWTVRDRATESIARLGVPHKLDVTLPVSGIAPFVDQVRAICARAGHDVAMFGHLGDGNLHVNVLGPTADDTAIDEEILRLVSDVGGSISAEHGIGRMKRPYLHLARSEAEISVFRAVKNALDPLGILNPGVLIPD